MGLEMMRLAGSDNSQVSRGCFGNFGSDGRRAGDIGASRLPIMKS